MYTIVKILKKTLTCTVHLCNGVDGTNVVVKRYVLSRLTDRTRRCVEREIEIMMSISHPNIICGIETFVTRTTVCVVQEFGARGDLFTIASAFPERQIPERDVRKNILVPITSAVAFLHSKGIIHRDIKPENIVVTADGVAKLCDFGLAIDTAKETPVSCVGTIWFMAPELLCYDPRRGYTDSVDVWSLGCLAFEMIMGESPFKLVGDETVENMSVAIFSGVKKIDKVDNRRNITHGCMAYIRSALTINQNRRQWPRAYVGSFPRDPFCMYRKPLEPRETTRSMPRSPCSVSRAIHFLRTRQYTVYGTKHCRISGLVLMK